MKRVETDEAATALADRLNGADRDRPVVVVTTPSGHTQPWIDVQKIDREVGDLAEVYLMPTGPYTWSFSNRMPAMTQVFGGAGRVYPVGHGWASNPRESPLRFAYGADEGPRATDRLIDDAMSMAALAGLTTDRRMNKRLHLEGRVARIVAERALVKLEDGRLGSVSPALAIPGLAVERVLVEGQRVVGWLDETTGWFDVREVLDTPETALVPYAVGDVVLAEVGQVDEARAELFLHPYLPVLIRRDEVTGNDLDDLRTLLTRGETVAVRVSGVGPDWRLSLLDIDDDDEPVAAVSLSRGGPPWLTLPSDEQVEPTTEVTPPGLDDLESLPAPVAVPPSPPAPGPDPRLLDPRRRQPTHAPAAPSYDPTELDDLRRQLDGLRQEVRLLRQERASLEARVARQEQQLADQRQRLRKAKRPSRGEDAGPDFADPEQGFRYAVLTAWARRTPVSEQATVPLGDFDIGPHFVQSLRDLGGISTAKVADVAFEIVTGRADLLPGRELHQYRESDGGGAPTVHRPEDGALLWRASLQRNTASARRIHFWRSPGGRVELWHVGTHDARPPR